MEKILTLIDFSVLNFFFSFDVPATEQNQIKIITRVDFKQLDLAFEETVNNFTSRIASDFKHTQNSSDQNNADANCDDTKNQFEKCSTIWAYFVNKTSLVFIFSNWLLVPLITSLIIMLFYVRDLFYNIYIGDWFLIEKKTKTFIIRNYSILRHYYWGIFLFYPRLSKSFFLKFPNPDYILNTFFGYFPWANPWSRLHIYIFVIIYVIIFLYWYAEYHYVYSIGSGLIFAYFIYKTSKFSETLLGLVLKVYLLEWKKKTNGLREDFFKTTFILSWFAAVPLYFAVLQLVVITICLVYLFFEIFFRKLVLWDGYFLSTLTQVYFVADTYYNITNWASNNHTIYFDYWIGMDGINVWMLWLTSLLVLLCILFLWENQKNDLFYSQIGWIFLLFFASIQFFSVASYFWMYIFFELSLLPIFVLVVYCGSNRRKIHAAYQMVLFTFIGSIFLLGGILLVYFKLQTFNLLDIIDTVNSWNSSASYFSSFERKIVWLFMFAGFAVKTPLYPFHIWLPEAHSEAPTTGSVLLAGVLLKMGTYGFMRYVMPLFPDILDFYRTLIFSMCICGIVLSSLSALAQIDIKKIIAYSSIGHMGFVILGLCTLTQAGLTGGCFMMLSHGLISSALFFCIGLLYKIYGTRSVLYYSAIAHFMPKFAICFYIFILANMGFPGTAGFPAEVLIFSAVVGENFFVALLMAFGSIIGGSYSIWLLTRILYGQINSKISVYRDLKPIERRVVGTLAILIVLFGIFSYLILDFFKPYCLFFEIRCSFHLSTLA